MNELEAAVPAYANLELYCFAAAVDPSSQKPLEALRLARVFMHKAPQGWVLVPQRVEPEYAKGADSYLGSADHMLLAHLAHSLACIVSLVPGAE